MNVATGTSETERLRRQPKMEKRIIVASGFPELYDASRLMQPTADQLVDVLVAVAHLSRSNTLLMKLTWLSMSVFSFSQSCELYIQ